VRNEEAGFRKKLTALDKIRKPLPQLSAAPWVNSPRYNSELFAVFFAFNLSFLDRRCCPLPPPRNADQNGPSGITPWAGFS
jgi:hypothetical protein